MTGIFQDIIRINADEAEINAEAEHLVSLKTKVVGLRGKGVVASKGSGCALNISASTACSPCSPEHMFFSCRDSSFYGSGC